MSLPDWVKISEGAKIHPSTQFIPFENKEIVIGKRAKIDSGVVIYGGTVIGNDSIIGHHTILRFNTKIGIHSVVGNLCMLEGNLTIGNHSLVTSNNHVCQKTTIGDYVFIGPICAMTNDPNMGHYRKAYQPEYGDKWEHMGGPTFGDGCRIAAGVTFLPMVKIGRQAVVGAGSIVTKDVKDFSIAYGCPATERGKVDPDEDLIAKCTRDHS